MARKNLKKVSCGILLFTALITSSFGGSLLDRVVASVNGEAILESDVKLGMFFYNSRNRDEVLSRLVDVWLINQFAQGGGLSVQEELLDQSMLGIAQFNRLSLEELQRELQTEGITLKDLREFLRREVIFNQGIYAVLIRDVNVSHIELALEKYKKGEATVIRVFEVLVLDKKDGEKVLKALERTKSLKELASLLGINPERLSVKRGELVDNLEKEVWRAKIGELVFAEDEDNIYVAQVLEVREEYGGRSLEELKEEVLMQKLMDRKKELIENLKKRSFIKLVE